MLTKKKDRNETRKRKFINVNFNNKSIRMQSDTRSNISITDKKTWKASGKPYLYLTRKVAKSVWGNEFIFREQIIVNVSVNG